MPWPTVWMLKALYSLPKLRTNFPSGSKTTMQSWCRRPDGPVLFLM